MCNSPWLSPPLNHGSWGWNCHARARFLLQDRLFKMIFDTRTMVLPMVIDDIWLFDGFGCCPSVRHAHDVMSPLSWGLLVVENVIRGTEAEQSHVSKWHFSSVTVVPASADQSCLSILGRYEHPCCLLYPVPGFWPINKRWCHWHRSWSFRAGEVSGIVTV